MLDLDMTPYALYVWSAWGVSALALIGLTVGTVLYASYWLRELKDLEKAAEDAKAQAGTEDQA